MHGWCLCATSVKLVFHFQNFDVTNGVLIRLYFILYVYVCVYVCNFTRLQNKLDIFDISFRTLNS